MDNEIKDRLSFTDYLRVEFRNDVPLPEKWYFKKLNNERKHLKVVIGIVNDTQREKLKKIMQCKN